MSISDHRRTVDKWTSHCLSLWGDLTRCTQEHLDRGTLFVSYPSFQVARPGYSTFQFIHV